MRALSVDAELSSLVQRNLIIDHVGINFDKESDSPPQQRLVNGEKSMSVDGHSMVDNEQPSVLRVEYKATTNRMLRVAVNGFMESLGVVLGVMEELDLDVLNHDES